MADRLFQAGHHGRLHAGPLNIVVIGAGISGLACAYELQRAGHDVAVFERGAAVGGRMSSRVKDGYVFDLGADHLCDLYDDTKEYCREFGIAWEPMRFLAYRVVKNGNLITMDDAIGRWSKLRLALQYFLLKSKSDDFFDLGGWATCDDENAYEFMRRRCGRDVADYLVDPFTSTYQFHRATEISKAALFGILSSLAKNKERWRLHRTQGGMQALPDAFASRMNVFLNTPVQSVRADDGGVLVRTGVDERRYDMAVLATTAAGALRIYENPSDEQRALLERTRYATTVSVAFRVPRRCMPDIAVVWVPFVESAAISGYVNEAMKGEETTSGDESLFCAWLHEDFARTLLPLDDDDIFRRVKEEILNVCPWFTSVGELADHDLQRWPDAMPKFAPGQLRAVDAFMKNEQGARRVYLCGDYLNAPWVEGALRVGTRVANRINRGA